AHRASDRRAGPAAVPRRRRGAGRRPARRRRRRGRPRPARAGARWGGVGPPEGERKATMARTGGRAAEPPPPRIWLEADQLRAGYTQCLNVLLPARALGASDKVVFFGVVSFAWQDGAAWPSIEALTARIGLSRATVLRSLGELKRVGLLKVRRRGQGM